MTANSGRSRRLARRQVVQVIVIGAAVGLTWFLFTYLPVTYNDWRFFRFGALHWFDPYEMKGVLNPPWLYPALYPLAVLPYTAGAGLLMVLSVVIIAVYVRSPRKLLFVVASAPMAGLVTLGQIDALLLVGLMLPPAFGLPVLVVKPQALFLNILPRLNWRSGAVLGVFVVGSIIGWGFWWQGLGVGLNQNFSISLFPYSIVLGLPLAWFGYRRRSDALLCAASLCLAPYFMVQSMLPLVAAAIRETDKWYWWLLITGSSWAYFIIMRVALAQI